LILNNPIGLLALLGVPLIIILYLLKQKRDEYIISSLYLWENAIRDMEANTPWQKLKSNLLMYLQIFAVLLFSLLLSQPAISVGERNENILIVLDCSLSMQSTDVKPSRFEAAKKDAVELIESTKTGTVISVIALTDSPYIAIQNVSDRQKAAQQVENLKVADTAENVEAAMELVESIRRHNPDIKVCWFADYTPSVLDDNISFYSYNRNGDNYSVTLFTYRMLGEGDGMAALGRIANFSGSDAELDVSLYADDEVFDAKRVRVGAGSSENIYWTGIPDSVSKLELRIDTKDVLDKDNMAGIMINRAEKSKVLLFSDKNVFLEKLFEVIPGIEVYKTTERDVDKFSGYDLYVFDSRMPDTLPADGNLIIFNPPENEFFSRTGMSEFTVITAEKNEITEGLGRDISFGALKTAVFNLPDWATPLMKCEGGFAAFYGHLENRKTIVFGFDLHDTNFPLKAYYPVIMTRAVQYLLPLGFYDASSVYAGETVSITADPEAREVYILKPGGEKTVIGPPFPVTSFDETQKIGLYTLGQKLSDEVYERQFYVNANTEKEFIASENIGTVKENAQTKEPEKPGWLDLKLPLLWLLMAVLMLEWWVYANGNKI